MYMKKIILKLCLSIVILFWAITWVTNVYADENPSTRDPGTDIVSVTEKVPWAWCTLNPKTELYDCELKRWFWSIMQMMWAMLKYFTYIAWLCAVLGLVVWWIMHSMWWADQELKTKSTQYMVQALLWLVVLLLSWSILYAIAPWVYK